MQGTELSNPTRLVKNRGNSIAINVKTSNGLKIDLSCNASRAYLLKVSRMYQDS